MVAWTLAHPDNECSCENEWGGSPWTDLKDFQDVLLNEKSKVQEYIIGCYPSCKKKKKKGRVYGNTFANLCKKCWQNKLEARDWFPKMR